MKKFFQKVKLDAKFKTAGEGHKLTDENSLASSSQQSSSSSPAIRQQPMTESQTNAAIAAIDRLEKTKPTASKKRVKLPEDEIPKYRADLKNQQPIPVLQVNAAIAAVDRLEKNKPSASKKRVKLPEDEITKYRADLKSQQPPLRDDSKTEQEEYVVQGVKFVSAITGEAVPKNELNSHYKQTLLMKLSSEEAVSASCLMIHTLNKDREKVDAAIKILSKYIDNITANEGEAKYRKIRKENKVFSDKVANLEGTEEFLNAAGFKLTMLAAGEKEELHFVFPNEGNIENLKEAKNCLLTMQPLSLKLYRDTKVFKPSDQAMKFHLPDSFYNLTLEEMRREQGVLSEEVQLNQQLRTKAMREKPKSNRKYNYSLIRVRFPDGYILQGTFSVNEKFASVRSFVSQNLNLDWVPYNLKTSLGRTVEQDEETLSSLSFMPSVLLNLSWPPDIQAQLNEQGIMPSLKSDLLQNLQTLS